MTHDYGERMSLMLDRRLSAQERAELEAHLAVCGECGARWAAFQQVDRVLSSAATVAPAAGFALRFAERARLAQRQALPAKRPKRERIIAWVGVFAAGTAALAFLIVPAILTAWFGFSGLVEGAPSLFVGVVEQAARWLVTFDAFVEAGRSILGTLAGSGGPILAGYGLMLVLITAAWIWVMRNVSRQRNTLTLPVIIFS